MNIFSLSSQLSSETAVLMMKSGLMTADQSSFFSIPLSSHGFIALSEKRECDDENKAAIAAVVALRKLCVMQYQKLHNLSHARVRKTSRSSIAVNNSTAWTFFSQRVATTTYSRRLCAPTHASISVNALIFISNYFTI